MARAVTGLSGLATTLSPYLTQLLATVPASQMAFYLGNESSGSAMFDISQQLNHGTYSGTTSDALNPMTQTLARSLDGINDFGNMYSTAFDNDWLWTAFTIISFAKVGASE